MAVRRDIEEIATKTLAALDVMEDCGRNGWTVTFSVLSCLTTVAASAATGGAAVGLASVSVASGYLAGNPPQEGPTTEFSGESPEAVIASMSDAISKLTQDLQHKRGEVAGCLSGAMASLYGDGTSYRFPRPALIDASSKELTGDAGLGYTR